MIHRTLLGSMERFVGGLVEHYAGAFPLWLAPVQAALIPITDEQVDYARDVAGRLTDAGLRVEVDDRRDRMQAKIRNAQLQKIPYMLVIGKREAAGRGRGPPAHWRRPRRDAGRRVPRDCFPASNRVRSTSTTSKRRKTKRRC